MSRSARQPLSLAALAYLLAFLQRPGDTVADTRVELTADPRLFLDRVASVWSPTADLGHVQGGQFAGYLFPQGPFHALAEMAGLPDWIAQRLWLGTLLALAAWGAIRVMDELWPRPRGVAHWAAGLIYMVNPYVVLAIDRGTVTLLAYAALPWLIVATHRGLADPRGWGWAAALGLTAGVAGGGVNAAVLFWALVGPLALAAWKLWLGDLRGRDVWAFAWRAGVSTAIASLWWVIPVMVQASYGPDFLRFTEQPGTIWATTSMSESLRLMGYWVAYAGVGTPPEPVVEAGRAYLFNAPVVVASFAAPLLAVVGMWAARTWRYAAFFGLVAGLGLLAMFAGFPEGAPFRRGLTWAYNHVEPLRVLRTTYKAAPLVGLAFACLGGAAVGTLATSRVLQGRRKVVLATGTLALATAVSWPLVRGQAFEPGGRGEPPAYWRAAVADAEGATDPGRRTLVLPGGLFGYYRWGSTLTPVAPALGREPLVVRDVLRYSDQRAAQLLDATDDLVQQDRLVPGQLRRLLGLMGVQQVLIANDWRRARSGSLDPAGVSRALAGESWAKRPVAAYGRLRTRRPASGRGGEPVRVRDIERFDLPRPPGEVRVEPLQRPVIVDGDAEGVVQMAATTWPADGGSLLYAGDLEPAATARELKRGARIVLTDSARRRVVAGPRARANRGPVLGPDDPVSEDSPMYEPFGTVGPGERTVALYDGAEYVRAPLSPGFALYPERRPFAAVDGDPSTSWLAGNGLSDEQRRIEIGFRRPVPAPYLDLLPHWDRRGGITEVYVSVNGGDEKRVAVKQGWNRIELGERALRTLRVRLQELGDLSDDEPVGGIAELRIPGVDVRERLALPAKFASSLRGRDLSRNAITILLARTTADFPRRGRAVVDAPQLGNPLDMADAEQGMEREVVVPDARTFSASGWAGVSARARDSAIDELVGGADAPRADSSGRFEGVPAHRASSALDGDARTAWVAEAPPGRTPWLRLRLGRPLAVRSFRVVRGPGEYRSPARLRVNGVEAAVDDDGRVALPRTVRDRDLRIDVVTQRPARVPRRRLRAVAIAELELPGLRAVAVRRDGRFATGCDALGVVAHGRRARLRVSGAVEALDAGRPLRAEGCEPLALSEGAVRLSIPPGRVMRADHVMLTTGVGIGSSPSAGRVVSQGRPGTGGERIGARLSLRAPARLVLAQSYSPGWRARCRDATGRERDLGKPHPVDGFANGWTAPASCRTASFEFGPQSAVTAGYWISGIGSLLLLALALLCRRGVPREEGLTDRHTGDTVRLGWRDAVLLAGAVALTGAFLFALRAGPVLGLAALVLARAGLSVKRLTMLAAAAVVVTAALYLVAMPEDEGGFSFDYARDAMAAHWVADFAVACLVGAGLLAARALRPSRRG